MTTLNQNLINHVALVLDGSGSMRDKERDVNKVVEGLVEFLATRSTELDQETHVTLYVFDHNVQVKVFDRDVLRLLDDIKVKGKRFYTVTGGWTALRDATIRSQQDLAKSCQLYGDHAFLTFVVTDGFENRSVNRAQVLQDLLSGQAENWTLGVLVPNIQGKISARDYGFPEGNIEIWDTNSTTGVAEVGMKVNTAVGTYMDSRASGIRGSRTLFSGITAANVTQAQVDASGMKAIDPSEFIIVPVVATGDMTYVIPKKSITKSRPDGLKHVEIMPFIEATGRKYVAGNAYYELVKSEKYEYHKSVALIHRQTKKVYKGEQAKALIGLTGTSTRIRPQAVKGGEYDIFVQSQSINRHLPLGSRVLLFNK